MNQYNEVKVGVSVLLTWNNQLLLAQRRGSHGSGSWDSPGGHLNPGERAYDCAIRETFEETGIILDATTINEMGFTEDFFEQERKHYISCVVNCEIAGETIKPTWREPNKFSTNWRWFSIDQLPSPLFIPIKNAIEKYIF